MAYALGMVRIIPKAIKATESIFRLKPRSKPGTSPGVLVADPTAPPPVVTIVAYDETDVDTVEHASHEQIAAARDDERKIWINVVGLGDTDLLTHIGTLFDIHPLVLEDIVNVTQRPKTEEYPDMLYVVTRMLAKPAHPSAEQVSLVLGSGFVITFQERSGDVFEPIRERMERSGTRIRTYGCDYLAYALLDAVVDGYFPALELRGDRLEDLDDEIFRNPTQAIVTELHDIKRELLSLRRAVWPQREMLNAMIRHESGLVSEQTQVYLRDAYDHAIQLMDIIETYRELAAGLIDMYLSAMSNRMNEVMKVLTIIATIFIPLSFVTGLYGMNFDTSSPWNMPELSWRYGYPAALGLMAVMVLGLIYYFWRKKWL